MWNFVLMHLSLSALQYQNLSVSHPQKNQIWAATVRSINSLGQKRESKYHDHLTLPHDHLPMTPHDPWPLPMTTSPWPLPVTPSPLPICVFNCIEDTNQLCQLSFSWVIFILLLITIFILGWPRAKYCQWLGYSSTWSYETWFLVGLFGLPAHRLGKPIYPWVWASGRGAEASNTPWLQKVIASSESPTCRLLRARS